LAGRLTEGIAWRRKWERGAAASKGTNMVEDIRLQALYPFLSGQRPDAAAMEAALCASVREKAACHAQVFEAFFSTEGRAVVAAARTLAASYRNGGKLLSMGNGGSSCDAAHVAVEFLHPVTAGRPALPAVNLTSDIAMLTAVGNDVGFDHVFLRQIIAHGRPGDSLIGFSTSGNSANLLLAFGKAREMGLKTIGLCGGSGGRMAEAGLDHCLVVPTDSIHRVQECHVAIYHMLWDLAHALLADDRGGGGGRSALEEAGR
jgi:D-sedoheptulose 7-phosphate isomerase